jgi:hypothetical protein
VVIAFARKAERMKRKPEFEPVGDDAPTPREGTEVPRLRSLTSRFTRAVKKRWLNWRGILLVIGFCVVFGAALVAFLMLSGPPR